MRGLQLAKLAINVLRTSDLPVGLDCDGPQGQEPEPRPEHPTLEDNPPCLREPGGKVARARASIRFQMSSRQASEHQPRLVLRPCQR